MQEGGAEGGARDGPRTTTPATVSVQEGGAEGGARDGPRTTTPATVSVQEGGAEGGEGGAESPDTASPSPVRSVQGATDAADADLWLAPSLSRLKLSVPDIFRSPSLAPSSSRLKLLVPDIFMYGLDGRVMFIFELKMYGGVTMKEAAEEQLRMCIYGNWRNGMMAMGGGGGGATCLGGLVTLSTFRLGWGKLTQQKMIPSYNLNNGEEWEPFMADLLSWIQLVQSLNSASGRKR